MHLAPAMCAHMHIAMVTSPPCPCPAPHATTPGGADPSRRARIAAHAHTAWQACHGAGDHTRSHADRNSSTSAFMPPPPPPHPRCSVFMYAVHASGISEQMKIYSERGPDDLDPVRIGRRPAESPIKRHAHDGRLEPGERRDEATQRSSARAPSWTAAAPSRCSAMAKAFLAGGWRGDAMAKGGARNSARRTFG